MASPGQYNVKQGGKGSIQVATVQRSSANSMPDSESKITGTETYGFGIQENTDLMCGKLVAEV